MEQLKTFVNATWYKNNTQLTYGGYYTDQLMELTDLTVSEIATLFDTSITTSLGYYVKNYANQVALKYGCVNQANCTADEIAQKQWGQSLITLNPINADPFYTPVKNTCLKWGAFPVYGCEQALEYHYWALVSGNGQSLSDA